MKLEENSLPSIRELHLTHLEDMHKQLVQDLQSSGTSEDRKKVQHIPTINLVYKTDQTRRVETL
jgi:disease resistance protein RPM1